MQQFTDAKTNTLDTKFASKTNPGLIQLIMDSVVFNPLKRKTAVELIKNPVFDKIRKANLEEDSPIKFNLKTDMIKIDKKTGKEKKPSIEELLKKIHEEVSKVN